jgi:hypothetical protein
MSWKGVVDFSEFLASSAFGPTEFERHQLSTLRQRSRPRVPSGAEIGSSENDVR